MKKRLVLFVMVIVATMSVSSSNSSTKLVLKKIDLIQRGIEEESGLVHSLNNLSKSFTQLDSVLNKNEKSK